MLRAKFCEGLSSLSSIPPTLSPSPVTNYLCVVFFFPTPSVLLSDILSFFNTRQRAQYVCFLCVIPCRRVSACWSGSPVAAAVYQRAGRSLCELTRTAPRETKTKETRDKDVMRWRRRERVSANQYKSKNILMSVLKKHPFTRLRNTTCVKTIERPSLMHTDLISLLSRWGSKCIALLFQKLHYSYRLPAVSIKAVLSFI